MGTVISSGTRTVKAGQSLVQPNISESGVVIISSGGEVSFASICSGGKMIVSSGGSDSASITFSAGSVYVQPSGFVYDHDVYGKGYVSAAGGRVFGGTVGSSGAMDIFGWSSGGSTVYGYASNVSIIKGGQMVLGYYATGSALKVSSGYVFVSSGGFLQEAVIGSGVGSSKSAEVYIKPNGSGHFNYVYSNGILTVSSAGTATSTKVYSGGSLIVYSGGLIKETAVSGGSVGIQPGGKVSNTTVTNNGLFYISSAATGSATTVSSGWMYLLSGATAYETTTQKDGILLNYGKSYSGTFSGGTAYVYGGSSYREKLLGGVMEISSYNSSNGYASDLTVQSAIAYLNNGASLVGANVSAGGKLYVYQGARASAVDVKTSGEVFVKSGGYLYGGSIYGFATIDKGGSAFGGNIQLLGYLDVYGSASAFKVSSGGVVAVSSGGRFVNGIMSAGAKLFVLSGGTALIDQTSGMYATISGGDLKVDVGNVYRADINKGTAILGNVILSSAAISAGELSLLSGCTASSIDLTAESSEAHLYVGSKSVVSSATISGTSASVDIAQSGTLNRADILRGASARVNGLINSCYLSSGGIVLVSSGGVVANATLVNEGAMAVRNSASLFNVTVSSGGFVTMSSGGSVQDAAIYSNGAMHISSGGSAASGYINVFSRGWLQIADGGYAEEVVLSQFGEMLNCGTAKNVLLYHGAKVTVSGGSCGFSATAGGSAVCFNGLLEGTVSSGGAAVFSGGTTRDITVTSGGKLSITKNLAMNSGNISFETGGNLDFDISGIKAPSDVPLFGNSIGEGYDTFILNTEGIVHTLSVSNVQAEQTYVLASNASTFNSTITLLYYGELIGTLTVGRTKKFGDKIYTLNLDDMANLSVTVAAPAPVGGDARNDIDGNGISDVLFQYSGSDYQLGYWMNGTNKWRGQGLAKPAEWEVLGSYDMNSNGNADAVLVGNVTTEIGGKGAYIGYYLDSIDLDSNWQNIGYLNNEEDIAWKNKVGNLTGNAGKNSIVWYAPELFALGAWTDSTTDWVNLSASFGGDDWTLVGCGDFDGDGKDSVVMSGLNGKYFYIVGIDEAPTSLGSANWAGWEIRAIGDFYGDGRDDLVLFHNDTGSMVMCADGNLDSYVSIGQLAKGDWFVVGAGDYDGDAKDDLLVRQYSSGMLGYYVSGDTSQWVEMGRGVDMNWTVIA